MPDEMPPQPGGVSLLDLMLRGAWVTIANPGNGSAWSGRIIAMHDDPGVVIEQADGVRVCLPQSFTVTEAPEPHAGQQPGTAPCASLGARIRSAREAAGLTQEALAGKVGVSQTAVSYWEAGKRDCGIGDLLALASALGVPAASLLPGDARPEPVSGRLARVEVKGFRDLGICRVTEGTFGGEPVIHAERTPMSHPDFEGDAADFPASSLHFVTWLPETVLRCPEPPRALPAGAGFVPPALDADGDPWTGDDREDPF